MRVDAEGTQVLEMMASQTSCILVAEEVTEGGLAHPYAPIAHKLSSLFLWLH